MQKLILDTNVLISSLIQRSYPFVIVDRIFGGDEFELCISDILMQEYHEVLNRRKFSKYPDFILKAEALLADIERKGKHYLPKSTLQIINDLADNRLLELDEESNANFLITGNSNDFTMTLFKETRIVSPKEFYEILEGL